MVFPLLLRARPAPRCCQQETHRIASQRRHSDDNDAVSFSVKVLEMIATCTMQRWATTDQIIWELCLDVADAGSIKYKGERLSFSGHIKVVGYEKTFGRSL